MRVGKLGDTAQAASQLAMPDHEVTRHVEDLVGLHLLRPLPGSEDGVLVPVSPEAAAAGLVTPHETRLRHQLAEAERLRGQLTSLAPLYAQDRLQQEAVTQLAVEELLDTVMALIEHWSTHCQHEVLTCQPGGGRAQELMDKAVSRDLTILGRGVRQRTLYQHTARASAPTQEYVRRITEAGGEVRTLPQLFGKMVAFDRTIVFIPCADIPTGAVVVREPSTVAFLCQAFDNAWSLASPYAPIHRGTAMPDEIKDAIVKLLADGMKDEVIARRLGMSLRTCRKHIAEIMDRVGAASRFQLGYLLREHQGVDPGARA
ncbi:LuxR C-terminal-related transcriptional regulator [Kitasatospora xanthocidica]|uniref:LuxR C-terminal-related transcriptional regulator n=1 Tax=Kitasatospora xanthocidica TaxID=83382 RepID=UPI0036E88AC6